MLLQLTDPLDCSEETILSIEEMPEVRPRGLIDTFPISNLAMSEAEGLALLCREEDSLGQTIAMMLEI